MCAYASASDVAVLTQNLIGKEETYTTSTSPTRGAVERWLSSGCAAIENKLRGAKYEMPPPVSSTIYSQLIDLNALFAAARAEQSRSNVVLGPGARTRAQVFMDEFWKELEMLCEQDLTLSGVSRVSSGQLFVGGISRADKRARATDSDMLPPRFSRGAFAFPGTDRHDDIAAS